MMTLDKILEWVKRQELRTFYYFEEKKQWARRVDQMQAQINIDRM
ncbi:MAG: hypothetical protein AB7T49_05690 [Oligoflexales bacterium]